MKTFLLSIVRTALVVLTLAVPIPAGSEPPPLQIAYPDFPPFHWKNKDNSMSGFFYDIIHEALEVRMGIPLVWMAFPWTRCQETVKSGMADALLTVPTEDRAQYTMTHVHPFYIKELHIFTYAEHQRITDIVSIKKIADIKKFEFSVITYSGNGWHKTNIQSHGIKTYETGHLENVWLMLAKKRGDIVIEWPGGAWPEISRLRLDKAIIDTGSVVSSMPFHLLIRKDSSYINLLSRFDKVIEDMRQDGSLESILQRYIL